MSASNTVQGIIYAVSAYLIWGLSPIYWKALKAVPAWEILGHRIVWSALFLLLLLAVMRRLPAARAVFQERRLILPLIATTLLISLNWFTFIWATNSGFLLEASLGYFINPLVNVLLGVAVLHERLRPWQALAVLLALGGVFNLIWGLGIIPWIALVLAFSFGIYGLLRKVMPADSLLGLAVETLLLAPVALLFLALLWANGAATAPALDAFHWGLLGFVGVFTVMPLLFFTSGARRLRYTTTGLLLYIGPTCQFILAVWVYGEVLTTTHIVTFACIWCALAIYTWDAMRDHRSRPAAANITEA